VAKTLTILLFLKRVIGNQSGLSAFDKKAFVVFESIWNFGTERFNYFIL
jgi:hypothetical protein